MPVLKDRVWLALVFGTLVWMALFAPFVDRTIRRAGRPMVRRQLRLNLAIVSVALPDTALDIAPQQYDDTHE